MRKQFSKVDQPIKSQWVKQLNLPVTIEQVNEITQKQYSRSSLLAMTKDWNLFVQFCLSRHVRAYPASTTAVRQFIEQESKTRKFATIRRYAVTISVFHQILEDPDPISHTQVRLLMMAQRQAKHGDHSQAQALERKHLEQLNQQLSTSESVKDYRDLAIYFVMFECALKRHELKTLTLEQLHQTDDEQSILTLHDTAYQLSADASRALARWINVLPPSNSLYIFRAINRHLQISEQCLDDSSIYRILRRAGEHLGSADFKFSGQSTRVGAAQELYQQGKKIKDIQSFGRWQSAAMPAQYVGHLSRSEQEKIRFKTFKPWQS